jgi:hypothetical protein
MADAQCIEVPMAVPTPNVREQHFVRAKRVKQQREVVTLALRTMARRPTLPVTVTLQRIAERPLDDDNLAFACKAIRDAIAEWLGCKDGPRDPVRWSYGQLRCKHGFQAIRITIRPGLAA